MEQKVARDGMLVADEVLACSIKLDDEEVLAVAADVVLEVQFNFVVIVKEEGKSPHFIDMVPDPPAICCADTLDFDQIPNLKTEFILFITLAIIYCFHKQ